VLARGVNLDEQSSLARVGAASGVLDDQIGLQHFSVFANLGLPRLLNGLIGGNLIVLELQHSSAG
jgi:hypothetical protein